MKKTLIERTTATLEKFASNPEAVKRAELTALCDEFGIHYTAKYSKPALVDFLKSAIETADELENKATAIENQTATNDADAPALVEYTKHDVTIANYPELVRIASHYGIETAGVKCADLRSKILASGCLSVRSTTSNGDGIRARNARICQTFITALLALLESIGFVRYGSTNKLPADCNGYTVTHNGGRIALNIDGLVRFTLFVQSAHLNIATRPADAIAIGYTDGGKDGNPEERKFGYLNYGSQKAFIKSIEYPELDNTELTADKIPADLLALFGLYGIDFTPENIVEVDETADNAPATDSTESDKPATDDKPRGRVRRNNKPVDTADNTTADND